MILVGHGRVGSVFARAGHRVVRRGEAIPAEAPIVICTPAAALPAVLAAVPDPVRDDCVIVQNGALGALVDDRPLTRGLLWFGAPGGGVATTNRPSLFEGRHAAAMVALCRSVDLPAEVITAAEWDAAWAEKMLWNAIFGLLGERYGETVGASAARTDEVAALVAELAPAFDAPLNLAEVTERLCAYSRAIASFSARVREYDLRNGWIIQSARARHLRTPLHDAAMRAIGRPELLEGLY